MTIQQLKYFVTICKLKSFNKASCELFVNQSTLSAAISGLEEECGFQLFERSNKGVRITQEGEAFFCQAQDLIDHFEAVQNELPYIANSDKRVRIGFATMSANNVSIPIINSFIKQQPACEPVIVEKDSSDLKNSLDQHLLDFVIIPSVDINFVKDEYQHKEIHTAIPLCLYCNISHPLACLEKIDSKSIGACRIAFWNKALKLEKMMEKEIAKGGSSLNVLGYLDQISTIEEVLRKNMAVAILPANLIKESHDVISKPFYIDRLHSVQLLSNVIYCLEQRKPL